MKNFHSRMGWITFAIIVIVVVLNDNFLFVNFQTSDWILLLGIGFIVMCIGNILNEQDKRRKRYEEQARRQKWIKSLHGK